METLVWVVHVLAAVGVIGLVLMQHGKALTWAQLSAAVHQVACLVHRFGQFFKPSHSSSGGGVFYHQPDFDLYLQP